jgi:uncharacterized protein YjeT (DUF2065 family)
MGFRSLNLSQYKAAFLDFPAVFLLFSQLLGPCVMLLIDRLELAIQQRSIKPNPPMEDSVRQSLPMILIRMMVGLVFLLEGILKFVRPEDVGAGRFAVIGIPFPQQVAALVGGVEIVGGAAILLNFYAGEAALVSAGGHPHRRGHHQNSHPAGAGHWGRSRSKNCQDTAG